MYNNVINWKLIISISKTKFVVIGSRNEINLTLNLGIHS